MEAQRFQGGGGTKQALLDGHVGQADQMNPNTAVDVDLHRDLDGVDPDAFCTVNVC